MQLYIKETALSPFPFHTGTFFKQNRKYFIDLRRKIDIIYTINKYTNQMHKWILYWNAFVYILYIYAS